MTFGPGVPARRSCSRMYCCSSSLTVCHSRCSSSAMSLMGAERHAPPDVECEPLGVAGIVGQEVEPLALHRAAASARDPAQLQLHEDPQASAREVANSVHPAIVDAAVTTAAHSAGHFFERRTSETMRTPGSPKTPTTVCRGRKPGKRYESERRRRARGDRILQSCHVSASPQPRRGPLPERGFARSAPLLYPLKPPKTQK